jgi:peptidyl-prolyl cis-trans isomerase A (cyclophilin A)
MVLALATAVSGCNKTPPEPVATSNGPATVVVPPPAPPPAEAKPNAEADSEKAAAGSTAEASGGGAADAAAAPAGTVVKKGGSDPLEGKWSLADAAGDLKGPGKLVATIETSQGTLECKLYDDKAPVTVANFIGLARGLRPWKDPNTNEWVKRPAYDGTTFHRIIKGFMIQGGDPKGNGSGEPGYVVKDEIWSGAKHDRAGLLCMANRGPNTNGAQFFITDAAAPHLDGGYTIFGECAPESVVHDIASVPVRGERPETPVTINKVTVARKK